MMRISVARLVRCALPLTLLNARPLFLIFDPDQ